MPETKLEWLEIEVDSLHMAVHLTMGRKKLRMLVDTGASKTVFDRDRLQRRFPHLELQAMEARTTGLGTRDFPGALVHIPALKLEGIALPVHQVVVLDLGHVNTSYAVLGFKPIDGVLGSDVLKKIGAVIHFPNQKLYFN
jgi:predicted aspartyl protease